MLRNILCLPASCTQPAAGSVCYPVKHQEEPTLPPAISAGALKNYVAAAGKDAAAFRSVSILGAITYLAACTDPNDHVKALSNGMLRCSAAGLRFGKIGKWISEVVQDTDDSHIRQWLENPANLPTFKSFVKQIGKNYDLLLAVALKQLVEKRRKIMFSSYKKEQKTFNCLVYPGYSIFTDDGQSDKVLDSLPLVKKVQRDFDKAVESGRQIKLERLSLPDYIKTVIYVFAIGGYIHPITKAAAETLDWILFYAPELIAQDMLPSGQAWKLFESLCREAGFDDFDYTNFLVVLPSEMRKKERFALGTIDTKKIYSLSILVRSAGMYPVLSTGFTPPELDALMNFSVVDGEHESWGPVSEYFSHTDHHYVHVEARSLVADFGAVRYNNNVIDGTTALLQDQLVARDAYLTNFQGSLSPSVRKVDIPVEDVNFWSAYGARLASVLPEDFVQRHAEAFDSFLPSYEAVFNGYSEKKEDLKHIKMRFIEKPDLFAKTLEKGVHLTPEQIGFRIVPLKDEKDYIIEWDNRYLPREFVYDPSSHQCTILFINIDSLKRNPFAYIVYPFYGPSTELEKLNDCLAESILVALCNSSDEVKNFIAADNGSLANLLWKQNNPDDLRQLLVAKGFSEASSMTDPEVVKLGTEVVGVYTIQADMTSLPDVNSGELTIVSHRPDNGMALPSSDAPTTVSYADAPVAIGEEKKGVSAGIAIAASLLSLCALVFISIQVGFAQKLCGKLLYFKRKELETGDLSFVTRALCSIRSKLSFFEARRHNEVKFTPIIPWEVGSIISADAASGLLAVRDGQFTDAKSLVRLLRYKGLVHDGTGVLYVKDACVTKGCYPSLTVSGKLSTDKVQIIAYRPVVDQSRAINNSVAFAQSITELFCLTSSGRIVSVYLSTEK